LRKYLIVINPVSGSGKAKRQIELINSYFSSKNLNYKILETEYPGHAIEIVKNNINDFDVIIAAGGDGTVNEVVNGWNFGEEKIFAVLPMGSGNDFASNLNLTKELNYNLDVITSDNPKIINSDVISVIFKEDENWFEKLSINALGIGFDAYVAYLNQHNKKISGLLSYILAVIKALKNLQSIYFKLYIDSREVKGNFILTTIGNGKTSGGGFYLNPTAKIDDEILNVTTVKTVKKGKLLKELPKALVNKMDQVKEVDFYEGKSIRIAMDKPYFVHSDGEILGTRVTDLEIKLHEKKLKMIIK